MASASLSHRITDGAKILVDTIKRLFTDPELVATAIKNLKNQPMRRNLTLLGIVIGISSIIGLLAIGNGLNASIQQQFEGLGLNTIHIQAGEEFSSSVFSRLRARDPEIVSSVPYVDQVIPFYETAGTVKNQNNEASVFLIGVEPEDYPYLEQIGYVKLTDGRYPNENDVTGLVVYDSFLKNAFPEEIGLRQTLDIKGKKFKIIGVSGQSDVAMGGFGITNMVFTSKKALETYFNEDKPMEMLVTVTSKERVDETAQRIERLLERDHGEKDFTVNTAESLLDQVLSILGVVQFFVIAIAAVSILVGGIGITNTMFMAVTERTREIGTMKAMGATDALIRSLFLAEAGIIGAIGGLIGIIAGYFLAILVSVIATQSGFALPIAPDIGLILFGIGFSVIIGVISGLAPAEKAIRLDPVEAIRYE